MYIALLLHIYQPPTQFPDTLKFITERSYQRIIDSVETHPFARLTLNINASLTQQLHHAGLTDIIYRISLLAKQKKLEFTASAAFHPILPHIPKPECLRQIKLNTKINQAIFGKVYHPKGFFPPELALNNKLTGIIKELGYKWTLVDGSAIPDKFNYLRSIYKTKDNHLPIFPRHNDISFRIAFGSIRSLLGLKRIITANEWKKKQYLIIAMDGETFGHYRPNLIHFLNQLFQASETDPRLKLVTISELLTIFSKKKSVDIVPSTWGYTEKINDKKVWVRWANPDNPLHQALDELRHLAFETVHSKDKLSRETLDKALNSDTYWWASGKPCWHPQMVKRGAKLLTDAIINSSHATPSQKKKAKYLNNQILKKGYVLFGKRQKAC